MKNKLEHIDHLFLDAADDASNFSTKKGWRAMKVRLLLSEIKAFNFTNVNRTYLLIAGLLLLLFSFTFVYDHTRGNREPELTEANSSVLITDNTEKEEILPEDEASQTETYSMTDKRVTQQTILVSTNSQQKNTQHSANIKEQQQLTIATPVVKLNTSKTNEIPSAKVKNSGLHDEPTASISKSFRQNLSTEKETILIPEEQTNPTPQFLLGLNAGFVFPLNESASIENIYQPVWMAGINFRYNRKHFFIETALAFSYFESDLNTTYRYDSLLGVITSSSYEIIETVNEAGETVLERQYTSELTPVYDTINSSDQVAIHAHSTLLHIPLRVGFPVFRSGNFYTAVYAGAVFRLLIARKQDAPQYGANKQPIIDYETNPVINYSPEFYFQGGLLLGYDISKSFSFEIYSSYNHLLGGNSTYIPAANIQAGLGIHFKF